MSGGNLLEKVLKIRSDIPVVLCTGYQAELLNEEIKNRLNALIQKPVENKVLLRTIREVLDGHLKGNPIH
jgi:two-component system cell cycle sensor histidine kinase/response regulator CckA